MRSTSLDPLGPARTDDARDPYRAERLRAQTRAERVARPQAAQFARLQAVRHAASAVATSNPKLPVDRSADAGASINSFGDAYTAHCLQLAIKAYHAQQARQEVRALAANKAARDEMTKQQARAEAANDLGTIQGLLPQQAYRYATGVPPIVEEQMSAAASVAPGMVRPVAAAAKARSSTDDAHGGDPVRAARAAPRSPKMRFSLSPPGSGA